MKLAFKHAIAAIPLMLSFAAPVLAGDPFEDGMAAFHRGDHVTANPDAPITAAPRRHYRGTSRRRGHIWPAWHRWRDPFVI
jgi:hypothetical protein